MDKKKIQNVGIYLIDEKDRLFCVHCHRGFNPPGGKVEKKDKDVFSAARREFLEEAGSHLPLKRSQLKRLNYRIRSRTCALFYNIRPLKKMVIDELIKKYCRHKIRYAETNDVALVPINLIDRNRSNIFKGEKYKLCDRVANFVPKATKFLQQNRFI